MLALPFLGLAHLFAGERFGAVAQIGDSPLHGVIGGREIVAGERAFGLAHGAAGAAERASGLAIGVCIAVAFESIHKRVKVAAKLALLRGEAVAIEVAFALALEGLVGKLALAPDQIAGLACGAAALLAAALALSLTLSALTLSLRQAQIVEQVLKIRKHLTRGVVGALLG